ncbi:MAG: AAA family ATPase, partial [Hyphomicrobiaceae bacterium]
MAAAKRYPPPNLLIMVADRYGWVPLPFAIAEDEFDAVVVWLVGHGRAEAVGDLRKVYQLDQNHLVPAGLASAADDTDPVAAYTLRSREDDMRNAPSAEALKKLEDDWTKLETGLRRALQEAAEHLAREVRIGETARAKYFLSLTEQEIIHGLPGYTSAAGNGAESAAGAPDAAGAQAIAWIREGAGARVEQRPSWLGRLLGSSSRPQSDVDLAAGRDPRVETLKAGLRRALPGDCVLSGQETRTREGRLDAAFLEDFATRIESRLRAAMDAHIAERAEDGELARERAEQAGFADERSRIFFGRDSQLAAIAGYLAGSSQHPLVLFGPSGLGKSALMAQAVAEAETAGRGKPVIYRFVGASAASSDVRSLLVSLIEDLGDRGVMAKPDEWEDDANKFDEQVRTLLKSVDRPAVVFIDALDQLKKPYRLRWLPGQLPPGLKIVVSVLSDPTYDEDSSACRALQQRLPSEAFLEIKPLSETDGRATLLALEASVRRRLRPSQRDYILKHFKAAGGSPLYLRVAFEIARGWRSWDVPPGDGRAVLAGDTAALIGQLITELTSVHHHEPKLVGRTLGLLAAAKDGLSAKEITEVLPADGGMMEAISEAAKKNGVPTPLAERHGEWRPKLPDSVWVRLHRQLAPLLTEKRVDEQPLLTFFHRQMADIARERHYAPAKAALHAALADYFDVGLDTATKDATTPGQRIYARRSLSELPYQLFEAGHHARLDEILMSPDWMQQKLAAHGVRTLIDDYQYARTQAQRLTGQTLDLAGGVLARDERQLVAQLLGRMRADLEASPADVVAIDGLLGAGRALAHPPALAPRWPSFTAPGGPELRRLEGHGGGVRAVAFAPDGHHVVSGSSNRTLRLWEVASGTSRTLEGHGGGVRAVAFAPDGRHVVSGSDDGTLRLWEVASGASRTLEGHGGPVRAVAFAPDGRHVVSGSYDGTLRLWEAASGASRALEGH